VTGELEQRLSALLARGVQIIEPSQTFVAPDVELDRIRPGAVIYPGSRLHGRRTYLGRGASVGREGPAVLYDCVLASEAAVDSGFGEGAVLLARARAGANAHLRAGTLLEEEASTAHAVGLKQTILLSYVTIGSLVNFCDVLMAGGTSRRDHSEVGSGYIHFNFTPWGPRGHKATASLVGDVPSGVFLRSRRIFLGGDGGMVGPRSVGFGAVTGAGQVLRRDVPADRVVVQPPPAVDRANSEELGDVAPAIVRRNAAYVGQLAALVAWYEGVRRRRAQLARDPEADVVVLGEALGNLSSAIDERLARLAAYVEDLGGAMDCAAARPSNAPPAPFDDACLGLPGDHLSWVKARQESEISAGRDWLGAVAEGAAQRVSASVILPRVI
jgi:hypothetical protein